MTDKAGARPSEPAKPAKRAAPRQEKTAEPVARAGGYVDRGDGNGWVLEEGES